MDGKCSKVPNTGNINNTSNIKYMDHVYCHTSQPSKSAYSNNMTTAGGGGGGAASSPNSDVLALLKENKQLKGMLILHLDLIQEQSDQLMAKDKALITQNEELETLRARNAALENHVQDLQRQLQRQIKRSGEMSTLPPPPLAKIQCKSSIAINAPTTDAAIQQLQSNAIEKPGETKPISHIIGECNGQIISKIVLHRVSSSRGKHAHGSPQSQTTDSEHEEDDEGHEHYDEIEIDEEDIIEEEEDEIEDEIQSIHELIEEVPDEQNQEIEEVEVDLTEDIVMQNSSETHPIDELYDTGNSTEDSNEVLAVQSKRIRMKQAARQSLAIPRGAKPSVSPASTTTNDGKTAFKAVTGSSASVHLCGPNQPVLSRGKQMTMMRWHAPDYHTDESVSCDSNAETEKRSTTSVTSTSPPKPSTSSNDKKRYHKSQDSHHHQGRQKTRKCTYISTPQLYSSREWEDEAFNYEYDFEGLKTESKIALDSETPQLEIPKWTEHDLTPSYCIEGTEDLSDDVFLKRHAKLEVDEKRRKKWDVQQIREQRRIERLKRRHYKGDVQQAQESPLLQSFYPTTENLQTICFVPDLPVQAFGEMIPKLATGIGVERRDFALPWLNRVQLQLTADNNKNPTVSILNSSHNNSTSNQAQQQMLNSSFVVLKKRKRQQSSSYTTTQHASRQRILTKTTTAVAIPPTTISSSTTSSTVTSSSVITSVATLLSTSTTKTIVCNSSSAKT